MEIFHNSKYKFKYNEFKPKINTINPFLENYRYKIFRKLESEFLHFFILKKLNKFIKPEKQTVKIIKAFGRWIMLQIALENNLIDPLIPCQLSKMSNVQLIEDIQNFTRDKHINADKLIEELNLMEKCKNAINQIQDFIKNRKIISFDKTIQINLVHQPEQKNYVIDCGDDSKTIQVSELIHDRIYILFRSNQSFSKNLSNKSTFYYLLYCLMLRYITISEEGVRQGALNQEFFNALENDFKIDFECFAASFAASSSNICSLFYDIERYFGSMGNFFTFQPEMGFFQVNPPLDSLITEMAMQRVINILKQDKNKYSLGFICFIPTWDHETIKKKGYSGKLELYNDFPIYYELKKDPNLILNYDVINKKIIYVQYQNKYQELGVFDCPHILILGNNKFKQQFNKNKMIELLNTFVKSGF